MHAYVKRSVCNSATVHGGGVRHQFYVRAEGGPPGEGRPPHRVVLRCLRGGAGGLRRGERHAAPGGRHRWIPPRRRGERGRGACWRRQRLGRLCGLLLGALRGHGGGPDDGLLR